MIKRFVKNCVICGKEFVAKHPFAIYCSVTCRKKAEYKRKLARLNRPETYTCVICGKEFTPVCNNGHNKVCSKECAYKYQSQRQKTAYREKSKPWSPELRKCKYCGKEFVTIYHQQIFCSRRCCGLFYGKRNYDAILGKRKNKAIESNLKKNNIDIFVDPFEVPLEDYNQNGGLNERIF